MTITMTREGFPVGGYRYDLEDSRLLRDSSADISGLLRRKFRAPKNFDVRPLFRLDPRDDVETEDQGQQGSCAGQAGTSVVELCNFIDHGTKTQLSRQFLYIAAQKEDGIRGDQGSTINGCCKVLRTYGAPEETVWPYPDGYDNQPPGGWENQYKHAEDNKVGSHVFLENAMDDMQFLRAGIGGIQIGVAWGGDVDRDGFFQWKPGRGGHSVAILGYVTIKGRKAFLMLNSWGKRWGMNGWAYLTMETVEAMHRHEATVFVGYSDMGDPGRRSLPVDFIKKPTFFRRAA